MMPEYVQTERLFGSEVRRVTRRHLPIGTSVGVWWCPFCDNSQAEEQMVCGKCGAVAITNPLAPVAESMPLAREDMGSSHQAEVAGGRGLEITGAMQAQPPAVPGKAAELGSVPVRRTRATRTPPPKPTPKGRKQ